MSEDTPDKPANLPDLNKKKESLSGLLGWFRKLGPIGKILVVLAGIYFISPVDAMFGPLDDIVLSLGALAVAYFEQQLRNR